MVQGVLETGQVDGTQYAVPMSINVKSIVFYPKQPFEAAGYVAPTTYDELVALSDEIQATGTTPWCFGIESEAATGWPATDWVENLMVINNGADVYNQWVNHEIPFNDDTVAETLQPDGRAAARRGPDQRRPVVDRQQQLRHRGLPALRRAAGLLHVPAGQLRRAGGRASRTRSSPTSTTSSASSRCPARTAEDKPVLGGGDLAGIFSKDNESAQKLVQFLASADFGTHGVRGRVGNWISPRTRLRRRAATRRETWKTIAQIANESTECVFDGSDQMPGEVGIGFVLARDDRVDQRRPGRQDDAGQHRGQLAAVSVGRGAGRVYRPAPRPPSRAFHPFRRSSP